MDYLAPTSMMNQGSQIPPNVLEVPPPVQDVGVDASLIKEHAEKDIDVLAALSMPDVYEYGYPPVLVSIWLWITSLAHKQRDFSKLAIGLPRGFAKSTLLRLFIIYCVLFTKKKFILVLSAT